MTAEVLPSEPPIEQCRERFELMMAMAEASPNPDKARLIRAAAWSFAAIRRFGPTDEAAEAKIAAVNARLDAALRMSFELSARLAEMEARFGAGGARSFAGLTVRDAANLAIHNDCIAAAHTFCRSVAADPRAGCFLPGLG